MILGESGKSSHTPVEILLLHKIFRYSRRILQAIKSPQLGKTMLQGLNPMLQEKSHKLCTRKGTSLATFQLLDAGQEWLDLLHLSFCGRRIPRGQFLQFLGGVKWGKAVLVGGGNSSGP
jgi:hypothetical protein